MLVTKTNHFDFLLFQRKNNHANKDTRKMIGNVKIDTERFATKIDVGPSAPPIIPIAPSLPKDNPPITIGTQ